MKMIKGRHITYLKSLYAEKDQEWVDCNKLVIDYLKTYKLALCGSIGRAICSDKEGGNKPPNDIDLIAQDWDEAMLFLNSLQKYLMGKEFWYGKILFQHQSKFCLPTVKSHIRFESSFWLPICIFILKEEGRHWFKHGLKIQYFEDNVKAKEELDKKRKEFVLTKINLNENGFIEEFETLNNDVNHDEDDDLFVSSIMRVKREKNYLDGTTKK